MAPTVLDAVNDYITSKARANRCDRYLRALRVSLKSFASGRGGLSLDQVSLADVEKWIFAEGWAARTRRGYLADARGLFRWAERRGWVERDPTAGVELPRDNAGDKPPGIHTPEEVRRVLETLRRGNPDACRMVAIRYFAGLRSAEAHRLREEDLLLDRGYVQVPAIKAKTRRRRLVKIQPALAAWLALGGELRAICPETLRQAVRLSGVPWKQNVTRHSFVSYHLAMWQNAGKTALEAGHSEQMLFAHYREVVTKEQAEAFWAIRPE